MTHLLRKTALVNLKLSVFIAFEKKTPVSFSIRSRLFVDATTVQKDMIKNFLGNCRFQKKDRLILINYVNREFHFCAQNTFLRMKRKQKKSNPSLIKKNPHITLNLVAVTLIRKVNL
jgi:hypothetical protein